jgi:hypothetical protein
VRGADILANKTEMSDGAIANPPAATPTCDRDGILLHRGSAAVSGITVLSELPVRQTEPCGGVIDRLDQPDALLEKSGPDIYDWLIGRVPVPAAVDSDVFRLLKEFKFHNAAP